MLRRMGTQLDRMIEQWLIGHHPTRLDAATGRDHHPRAGIIDARCQLLRRKAAEHHGVDGAKSGAGEHGKHRFGDHRHVDDDAIPLLHTKPAQHGSHGRDLVACFSIADRTLGAGNGLS